MFQPEEFEAWGENLKNSQFLFPLWSHEIGAWRESYKVNSSL
jgi:hypothetical protein